MGDVQAALDAHDPEAVAAAFRGMDEKARRAWAPQVRDWWGEPRPGGWNDAERRRRATHQVARWAVDSLTELKKDWRVLAGPPDRTASVLLDRRPPWLAPLMDWLLDRSGWSSAFWGLARALVRAEAIPRPADPNYTLGMLSGVYRYDDRDWRTHPDDVRVRLGLDADPALLEDDLWRVFEVEGSRDNHLGATWSKALLQLQADGVVPRDRLLDASLAALARDFAQHKAGWYSRFHEDLAPTQAERAARLEAYLPLLTSRIRPTVAFALNALTTLDAAAVAIPADRLCAYLPAALRSLKKSAALEALTLLAKTAGPAGAPVAAEALAHERAEVQKAAIDLLDEWGVDAALRAQIAPLLDGVAPTLQARVADWRDAPVVAAPDDFEGLLAEVDDAPSPAMAQAVAALQQATRVVADDSRRPRVRTLIEPIEEVEALIDTLAALLEDPVDADAYERVLDGVSRLCDQPTAGLGAPLVKRARALLKRSHTRAFSLWSDPRSHLCGLALAWLASELDPGKPRPQLEGFCVERLLAVAKRAVARRPSALLAAPTHVGGWIDTATLVERVRAASHFDEADTAQALLRLDPDDRPKVTGELPGAAGQALAFALGLTDVRPASDRLFACALRARDPGATEARLPTLPDAGRPARWTVRIEREGRWGFTFFDVDPAYAETNPVWPTVALHAGGQTRDYESGRSFPGQATFDGPLGVRMAAQVWPAQREGFYVEGCRRLANNLDAGEAAHHNRIFLEPLLAPDEPLGINARRLIALGLGCKVPEEWTLAVDVALAAFDDGRLDGAGLGAALADFLPHGLMTPPRLAKALAECARASPLAEIHVADAIFGALRGADTPRGMHAVLQLALQLCTATGGAVEDDQARAWLQARATGSTQTAKAARALLALTSNATRADALRRAAAHAIDVR